MSIETRIKQFFNIAKLQHFCVFIALILAQSSDSAEPWLRNTSLMSRIWLLTWLRHCATSWKVAGSIPDGVIGIFH
jgi:hypothetical protein